MKGIFLANSSRGSRTKHCRQLLQEARAGGVVEGVLRRRGVIHGEIKSQITDRGLRSTLTQQHFQRINPDLMRTPSVPSKGGAHNDLINTQEESTLKNPCNESFGFFGKTKQNKTTKCYKNMFRFNPRCGIRGCFSAGDCDLSYALGGMQFLLSCR